MGYIYEGHQLLDACSSSIGDTGGIQARYTRSFDEHTLNDIKQLLRINPDFVKCNYGTLRCRNYITPLYYACINPNIPLETIKLPVSCGANPHRSIKLNVNWADPMHDITHNFETSERMARYNAIAEYFNGLPPFEDSDIKDESEDEFEEE